MGIKKAKAATAKARKQAKAKVRASKVAAKKILKSAAKKAKKLKQKMKEKVNKVNKVNKAVQNEGRIQMTKNALLKQAGKKWRKSLVANAVARAKKAAMG